MGSKLKKLAERAEYLWEVSVLFEDAEDFVSGAIGRLREAEGVVRQESHEGRMLQAVLERLRSVQVILAAEDKSFTEKYEKAVEEVQELEKASALSEMRAADAGLYVEPRYQHDLNFAPLYRYNGAGTWFKNETPVDMNDMPWPLTRLGVIGG